MDIWSDPKPWLVRECVEYLEAVVSPEDLVLEFGGGASTIWWAKRCQYTYTAEASVRWASVLIEKMIEHPDALAKWSMIFAPCEWTDNHETPKPFWQHPRRKISREQAEQLERAYLNIAIPFVPTIIVIDGSVRARSLFVADQIVRRHSEVRMVVVDNMETMSRHTSDKFPGFAAKHFDETDLDYIPKHQNNVWRTTVFERI